MTWKNIPGCPGYKINKKGDVMSFRKRAEGKLLKPVYSQKGYKTFFVGINYRPIYAHKLVLITFVGNPKPGQVARHLNGNRTDNRVRNLKWGTVKQNHHDAIKHGTWSRHEKHGRAKLNWKKVDTIRSSKMSSKDLATKFGVHICTIRRVKNHVIWNKD